jgi:GntR family transcriptional regulator
MIQFRLDPKNGRPFYRQIIDQIKYGIAAGKLEIGEQLPTVRSLANDLKVNLNTIAKAYKELEIRDVLKTQQGTGTFISETKVRIPESDKSGKLKEICEEFSTVAFSYGFTIDDIIEELRNQKQFEN